jgi:hypothetical protein
MSNPYPQAKSPADVAEMVSDVFVECTNCIALETLTDEADPVEWARNHTETKPTHTRFRLVSTKRFSV